MAVSSELNGHRSVVGAVLAGGASRRMGRDKALVPVHGIPMARRVADAMSEAGAGIVVLVGATTAVGAELGLDVVADLWPGEGPLAGTASALAWASGIDGAVTVLVAACDQPALSGPVFELVAGALVAPRHESDAVIAGAVTTTPDGRRHPFPAAWRVSAAPVLRSLVDDGARRADAAFSLGVVTVPVALGAVSDMDRPEDLLEP